MKTWNLDEHNDLIVKNGRIDTVDNLKALRVRIQNALQTFKGELEDNEQGVDYFGIMLREGISPVYKLQEFKRVILNVSGVSSIENSGYQQDKRTGNVTYIFIIKSIYGELTVDQTVEV